MMTLGVLVLVEEELELRERRRLALDSEAGVRARLVIFGTARDLDRDRLRDRSFGV